MEAYTIEDVELLRRKSGMSYQEAVALLEYHNGNLARALIDLEKNGKLQEAKNRAAAAGAEANRGSFKSFMKKMYQTRVKIHKGETPVLNLSVLYAVPCLVCAPHITVAGIIVSMILGYRFSFSQMDEDFASDNLKKMVKNAAENARASVDSVVRSFSKETDKKPAEKEVPTIQVPVQTDTRDGNVKMDDDEKDGYSSVTIG